MVGSKFNLGSLMKNAKKIQEMMQQAQEDLAEIIVEAEAGAGLVKVRMNAQHDVLDLIIDPELKDESLEVIQDLLKAALNSANQKALKIAKQKILSARDIISNEDDE